MTLSIAANNNNNNITIYTNNKFDSPSPSGTLMIDEGVYTG